ncbi:MAG TPA: ABC transporter permease [Streptosporangiaceae bacterium]|nr:ABC transporter permease [Streptosporangiaceae bacterium]
MKLVSLSRAMFLGFVRDRAALIFSILLPVLFLLFFGSIYKNANTPKIDLIAVGQVNLIQQAQAHGGPQLGKILTVTHDRSLSAALASVRKGNADGVVQQEGNQLVLRYSAADPTKASIVQQVVSSIVQVANEAGHPATYRITSSQVEDKTLKPIQYVTPGLLGWALASGAAFGAGITLVSWRENKLLRRLRLAPVGIAQVVMARIGISVVVGLIQLVVFLAIAVTPYFGLKLTSAWWMAIPLVVCGILAFMSIGLFVGSVAKTQQAASSIVNLIILPMAFLGGAFLPLDFAPNWVRDASYAMPLRYLVVGMQDVMARGEGPSAALPAIGILLGFAAIVTLISVRVFRWDDA